MIASREFKDCGKSYSIVFEPKEGMYDGRLTIVDEVRIIRCNIETLGQTINDTRGDLLITANSDTLHEIIEKLQYILP